MKNMRKKISGVILVIALVSNLFLLPSTAGKVYAVENTCGQKTYGQSNSGQNTCSKNTCGQNSSDKNTCSQNTCGQNTSDQSTCSKSTCGQNTCGQSTCGQNNSQIKKEQKVYAQNTSGQNKVKVNGKLLQLDSPPVIKNGYIRLPVRAIIEALGGSVDWNEKERKVTARKGSITIELKIGSTEALVNNKKVIMDVPAEIEESRTKVPIRFVSENFGAKVNWDESSRTAEITTGDGGSTSNINISGKTPSMGESLESLTAKLGQASRKDASEYSFQWHIFNKDYKNYIQVGIKDNVVAAFYTNSNSFILKDKVKVGTPKTDVRKVFGEPVTYILKGNTRYNIRENDQYDTFLTDGCYLTVFYDITQNANSVTAIQMINKSEEEALKGYFGEPSEDLKASYEKEMFDLVNSIRVRMGKAPYEWDDKIAKTARDHSKDMAVRKFFDHNNPDGKSPFERMKDDGLNYTMAAENISAGQGSAIFAHEGLMNSPGHRSNILGDCKRLGVGVWFGGEYKTYFTQNFYTPR